MSQRPLTCPGCSSFVRSGWGDSCEVCGTPLASGPPAFFEADKLRPQADIKRVTPASIGASLIAVLILAGGGMAVASMKPGEPPADSAAFTFAAVDQTKPIEWVEFTDDKSFKAKMLAAPKKTTTERSGVSADMYKSEASNQATLVYVAPRKEGFTDQQMLEHMTELLGDNGLTRTGTGDAEGYAYTDMRLEQPQGIANVRVLATPVFMFMVVAGGQNAEQANAAFAQLTASFVVLS